MKISLKAKLIFSYTALSLLLVTSLLVISNTLLENQFKNYMVGKQEEKNQTYVNAVLAEFETGKTMPRDNFYALGQKALGEGIILMVKDHQNREVFCMSCYDNLRCENMLDAMRQTMQARYPGFEGAYAEKVYALSRGGAEYGTVTLGYYGPYYLLDADIRFMDVLNQLYAVAGVVFFLFAIGLGFLMAARISKPIALVTQKTRQIERGDCAYRIDIRSNTKEIEGLISSVNALASTLEAQQDIKKRMANDYAHEFRTPLAAIQSNLEGIIDGVFEPSQERLTSIHTEILRLGRMVSQIDKIVALESDGAALHKENVALEQLLKQILSTFEAEINEKSIQLSAITAPCNIMAEKDKISSVIVNLLSNAIKYTDFGGSISVTLHKEKEDAVLSFADSGVGIGEDDLPHIFEHLYRTDLSRSRDTGGSGIGLSVVNAIVTAHGGKIEVKSEIGKGSLFTITLPLNKR